MGLFSKPKSINYSSQAQKDAKNEKEDAAKVKARLLETEGKNNGAELQSGEGRSIRRIFN